MEKHYETEMNNIQSRLRFDYKVVSLMRSPLLQVEAYLNVDDLKARRNPVTSVSEGHLATHYRVDYNLRTLTGPGSYSKLTTVHVDLFANIDYPVSDPACWVIESELPWTPHVADNGWICIGKIWEAAAGNMLLGELLVHIAKLLNFDEPEYKDPNYEGFRPDAIKYWITELKREPITKNLRYPMIPSLLLDDVTEAAPTPKITLRRASDLPIPNIKIRSEAQARGNSPLIRISGRQME